MKEYIVTEHPYFPYEEPKPPELIRCKDCYWYVKEDGYTYFDCWHYGGMTRPEPNDFCSWAERKDNETD